MRFPVALMFCALALPAHAAQPDTEMVARAQALATQSLRLWAADPVLVDAITAQNTRHASLTQAQIDALDVAWRDELGRAVQPTVDAVVTGAAADFLRLQVEQAEGLITEVFVMDNHGLNVAASAVTSDYWQGDEAKFTETFPKGASAIHVSDVEFDESTQAYQLQVSFPIVAPADGAVIGAITVALNAEQL